MAKPKKKTTKKKSKAKKMSRKKVSKKKKATKTKKTKATKKAKKKAKRSKKAKATKKSTKKGAKKARKKSSPKVKKPMNQNSKVLEGKKLPAFQIPATRGQIVSTDDFKDKKVVLFFYPKDMTPGCTIEGHEFSELKGHFAVQNTLVFGVSRDSVASHEKFIAKENYTVDLLSDEDEKLCKMFDVIKLKNMYGKKVRGIERSTFLVDESGKIIKEWRKVKAPEHAAEVLSYVESLK